ncbi:alkaline phosphatase D family protein [Actinomadura rugatobispora]|uniref:Alkaline phosphatase D family protein n=1 Tax=Actinomadura rugatobispora TaxID=1994 RepID=A0ABW0ZVF5_9ACTN|nr:alkaline phosphatase D family protein [Actinomadura rugatobispora]
MSEVSRRTFLGLSFAAAVTWSVGEAVPASAGPPDEVARLFQVRNGLRAPQVFPQSVASGDPSPDGVVLWTRVAPDAAGRVAYEIAADASFAAPLVRGVTTAAAGRDHTVKVRVAARALRPWTTYHYRFIVGGTASRTGRFRTLPAPGSSPAGLRFGYISCQDYTNGHYTALRHLAEEDLDFVVHLGDYIYETTADSSFQGAQVREITLPSGRTTAQTLGDYRALYKTYRSDPDLQRLHERFAVIQMWDDHEFANDSYGAYDTDTEDEAANYAPERKLASVQAWSEYSTAGARFDPSGGPTGALTAYRTLRFGGLMDLVLTDERTYRSKPPCGLGLLDMYATPGCPERLSPERTMLGAEQRAWFTDQITSSTATWKVWGNEVMCMQFKLLDLYLKRLFPDLPARATSGGRFSVFLNLDQWDGFPVERQRLLTAFRDVDNLVTITGDLHSFGAGYLRPDFDDPSQDPVGVSLLGGSVTSANFVEMATFGQGGLIVPPETDLTWALRGSNPHLEYFNSAAHGYVVMDVTPSGITATMKAVRSIRTPETPQLLTLRTFRVGEGRPSLTTMNRGTRTLDGATH